MKLARLMLLLFLALQMSGAGLVAQNAPRGHEREINEQGGAIPGIEDLNQVRVYNTKVVVIEGVSVQVSSVSPANPTRFDYTHEIANKIFQYAINGKPFCYRVLISTYEYDKATKTGGDPGYENDRTYYDEDGNGSFETREYFEPEPGSWPIRLPEWVKKANRKQ